MARKSKKVDVQDESFEVAIIGRVKHGKIRKALKDRNWTQRQGAEFIGTSYQRFCAIARLGHVPDIKKMSPVEAKKWEELTGFKPETLWPAWMREKAFRERPKVVEFMREVTPQMLMGVGLVELPMAPDAVFDQESLRQVMNEAIERLPPREREAIISELDGEDVEVAASRMGVGRAQVYNLRNKAIRILRQRGHRALRQLLHK